MKPVGALIVAALLLLIRPMLGQRAQFVIAETGTPVTITLSSNVENGFRIVTIEDRNHRTQIHPKNPVVCTDNDLQEALQQIEGAALDPSGCFLHAEYGKSPSRHTLLFFAGHGYASGAAPALVLGFKNGGTPFRVLEREEFDVTALQPTAGLALIIGRPSLSEEIGPDDDASANQPYLTTYDPFAVYVVRAGSRAAYSLAETRRYNIRHYIWHGAAPSEHYDVVHNMPGHREPFGLPDAAARALIERAAGRKQ